MSSLGKWEIKRFGDSYYIAKLVEDLSNPMNCRYLHRDGISRRSTKNWNGKFTGLFDSYEDAERVLNKYAKNPVDLDTIIEFLKEHRRFDLAELLDHDAAELEASRVFMGELLTAHGSGKYRLRMEFSNKNWNEGYQDNVTEEGSS